MRNVPFPSPHSIVACCCLAFVWLCIESTHPLLHAADILIADFEQKSLSDQWTVAGPITAKRELVEESAKSAAQAETQQGNNGVQAVPSIPAGRGLVLHASGRGVVRTLPGAIDLQQIEACEELRLWIHAPTSTSDDKPVAIDLMFVEADSHAAFWRKLEIKQAGWQEYRLPLEWFRWEQGRVPEWKQVTTFAVRIKGACELMIDEIRLIDYDPQAGVVATVDELAALAFPNETQVRRVVNDHSWLLTDVPELDLAKLQEHLDDVRQAFLQELQIKQPPAGPAKLILFSTTDQYRDFVVRFGAQLNAVAAPPKSAGYHLQGLALSTWDAKLGSLRPVYTHEYVHSLLSHAALIDSSRGDWFQEGIASMFQVRYHPQEDWRLIVRQGLERESARSPFEKLVSGEDIAMHHYWQAATFCEFLLQHAEYAPQWPQLMRQMHQRGSTDVRLILPTIYKKSWAAIEHDWHDYCHAKYVAQ